MVTSADLPLYRFSKMHGAGNDFVVLDLRESKEPSPELCRIVADRHMGVGCDLILGIDAPRSPYAVIEVSDIDTAPVAKTCTALQSSHHFPHSVNVGFAEIVSRDQINLRVYEYGAGKTLACGSGACAAVAVFMRQNRIDREVSVLVPGGCLEIVWETNTSQITMNGPATFVFEGQLDVSHTSYLEDPS